MFQRKAALTALRLPTTDWSRAAPRRTPTAPRPPPPRQTPTAPSPPPSRRTPTAKTDTNCIQPPTTKADTHRTQPPTTKTDTNRQDGHQQHPAPRHQPAGESNDAPPPMDDMQDYRTLGRQRSPTRGYRRSPFWDETTPRARISSQPETTLRTKASSQETITAEMLFQQRWHRSRRQISTP